MQQPSRFSKDVEAPSRPVSRTTSRVDPPPPPLSPRTKRWLIVASVVLVACVATGVAVGVVGGLKASKDGSSSGDGAIASGNAAPSPSLSPKPSPAAATPAAKPTPAANAADAGAQPAVLPPLNAATPAPAPAAAAGAAAAAGGPVNFTTATPPFLVPGGYKAVWWDEFDSAGRGDGRGLGLRAVQYVYFAGCVQSEMEC